jgi:uncharacterized membrane protein
MMNLTKTQLRNLAMLFLALLTYLVFIAVVNYFPELSGLPYAINKALIGCLLLKLVDEFMLYEVQTMQKLKENAVAYSLYMLAYALIIALSIAGA